MSCFNQQRYKGTFNYYVITEWPDFRTLSPSPLCLNLLDFGNLPSREHSEFTSTPTYLLQKQWIVWFHSFCCNQHIWAVYHKKKSLGLDVLHVPPNTNDITFFREI